MIYIVQALLWGVVVYCSIRIAHFIYTFWAKEVKMAKMRSCERTDPHAPHAWQQHVSSGGKRYTVNYNCPGIPPKDKKAA